MGLSHRICCKFVEETVRSPHLSRKLAINSLELVALGSDITEDRGHCATLGTEGQSLNGGPTGPSQSPGSHAATL